MGVVFIAFLVIGLAMPVLPLHVSRDLGLGTFVVGLVAGSQFAASLVSRVWAGTHADTRGAKRAVVAGLLTSSVAGLLYLLSLRFVAAPALSVAVLLLGRGVLGAGESFIITGAQAWGLALAGPRSTGRVLAWMGTAMYAAFALGAPLGTSLYGAHGFAAIGLATTLVPFATLSLVAPMPRDAPNAAARPSFTRVLAAVWLPGAGLALSSFGFGSITAFVSLTAFLDLTLGLGSPVLGLVGAVGGIGAVILASAVVVLCAARVALRLLRPAVGDAAVACARS